MRRREIFPELTSLLDVIMIMLFVLLTQARTQTAEALSAAEADRAEATELRAELSGLRQERDAALERAEALDRARLTDNLVLDESLVITLSVESRGNLRLESGEIRESIPYDWDDDTYAANALRARLLGMLRQTDREAVFIVFQFDRTAIYHAEYTMIGRVMNEIKLEAKQRDVPLSYMELDIGESLS